MKDSAIEWTHHTFNPWWGCQRVSPACENCYAESLAKRYGHDVWGPGSDRRMMSDNHWRQPAVWNRTGERQRVFCASMADVFEDRRELDKPRQRLFDLIGQTQNLDWLLLTKRPQNVDRMVPVDGWWPGNVWLGTTVEDQRRAEERMPHLLSHEARVRFLSCEPLLGPLDLRKWLPRIDWVILGGESGPGSREMQLAWARSVRDQCIEANVPLLFKQWGNHAQVDGGEQLVRLRTAHERMFDGRTWDEYPRQSCYNEVVAAAE